MKKYPMTLPEIQGHVKARFRARLEIARFAH
jgi:hypothetical protein